MRANAAAAPRSSGADARARARRERYNHFKKYESYEPSYSEESSDESSDYSEPTEASGGDAQIVNVAVTVNIAQAQG